MKNSHRGSEGSGRAIPGRTAASQLELVDDHPRRIDAWIDYFGTGDTAVTAVSDDACGEGLLDY